MWIESLRFAQRIESGKLAVHAKAKRSIAQRQIQVDQESTSPGFLRHAKAKLQAAVVTPEPPFAPTNTKDLPTAFLVSGTN